MKTLTKIKWTNLFELIIFTLSVPLWIYSTIRYIADGRWSVVALLLLFTMITTGTDIYTKFKEV